MFYIQITIHKYRNVKLLQALNHTFKANNTVYGEKNYTYRI